MKNEIMTNKRIKICYGDEEGISFKIPSASRDEYQYVSWDTDNGWSCTCEHYHYRKKYCKHMNEAKRFLQELNEEVQKCDVPFTSKL